MKKEKCSKVDPCLTVLTLQSKNQNSAILEVCETCPENTTRPSIVPSWLQEYEEDSN